MYSEDNKEEDKNIVRYCNNCFGLEPCLCGHPDYTKTWDFVYWAFKNCKM